VQLMQLVGRGTFRIRERLPEAWAESLETRDIPGCVPTISTKSVEMV